jgi:hypothetical protein
MWAGRLLVVQQVMAVRVVSLGKSTGMLAMVTEVISAVVRGATYCLWRSLVLCQDLAGSQDA